jgi:hypothetical protein
VNHNTLLAQPWQEFSVQESILPAYKRSRAKLNGSKGLQDLQACTRTFCELLKLSNPNLKEFIEIVRNNREITQSLEQRHLRIFGLS